MFTASDIKNINFSTTWRGYSSDEVDAFLDKIMADYNQYESVVTGYKTKIEELEEKIKSYELDQDKIQNVLLSAQKLADQIVSEAREKSEEIVRKAEANIDAITDQERELASVFEVKANERKAQVKKELEEMIAKAELKAKSIMDAADDAVARQQALFDRIKAEIADFKAMVMSKYKEHCTALQSLPETVDFSPEKLAEILSAKIDEIPNIDLFVPTAAPKADTPEIEDLPETSNNGFVVEEINDEEDEDNK